MSSTTRAIAQVAGNAERAAATKLRNQELGKRTLYLKVSRAPVSFNERRSILRALEQHGPVEFFKLMPVWLSPACMDIVEHMLTDYIFL